MSRQKKKKIQMSYIRCKASSYSASYRYYTPNINKEEYSNFDATYLFPTVPTLSKLAEHLANMCRRYNALTK